MFWRLLRALRGRRLGEIVVLAAKNVVHLGLQATPRARRVRAQDRAFDQRWGTDTSGTRNLGSLKVDSDRARHGVRYQASDDEALRSILDEMAIPYPDYTFIDFGCGKGRIVLAASLYEFKRVVGVDFSDELVSIAKQNIDIFRRKAPPKAPMEIVCTDAADFAIPSGNLLAYFYNPFDATVMAQVVTNLETALDGEKREILAIYVDPRCIEVFEKSGSWTKRVVQQTQVFSARIAL